LNNSGDVSVATLLRVFHTVVGIIYVAFSNLEFSSSSTFRSGVSAVRHFISSSTYQVIKRNSLSFKDVIRKNIVDNTLSLSRVVGARQQLLADVKVQSIPSIVGRSKESDLIIIMFERSRFVFRCRQQCTVTVIAKVMEIRVDIERFLSELAQGSKSVYPVWIADNFRNCRKNLSGGVMSWSLGWSLGRAWGSDRKVEIREDDPVDHVNHPV